MAAFAIDDLLLPDFNHHWSTTLAKDGQRPAASYIHMKELLKNEGTFSTKNGWDDQKRAALVLDLLMYMQTLDKKRVRMFGTTVDLNAYRRLARELANPPSAIRLCNYLCPKLALQWYIKDFPGLVSAADFYFDRSEPFRHDFTLLWVERKGSRFDTSGVKEAWHLIRTVDIAKETHPPGMQAADLLAWGMNRRICSDEGDFMKYLSHFIQSIVPATWVVLDEVNMLGALRAAAS